MEKVDMTQFDKKPEGMINYLRYNGPHFNEKLCEFAVGKMTKKINGKEVPITPFSKKEVDLMLENYGIVLEHNELRDYVYVANMCKADFLGHSIEDNLHVARYIKDVIDDDDAYDGIVFNRWLADMARKGEPIDWDDFWMDKI
jgi:hypothetical protein